MRTYCADVHHLAIHHFLFISMGETNDLWWAEKSRFEHFSPPLWEGFCGLTSPRVLGRPDCSAEAVMASEPQPGGRRQPPLIPLQRVRSQSDTSCFRARIFGRLHAACSGTGAAGYFWLGGGRQVGCAPHLLKDTALSSGDPGFKAA